MARRTAVPLDIRRALAMRYGAIAGRIIDASCHWCGKAGKIYWSLLYSGHPSCWVTFDLEIDHLRAIALGGTHDLDNIVLACRRCNRGRFNRRAASA